MKNVPWVCHRESHLQERIRAKGLKRTSFDRHVKLYLALLALTPAGAWGNDLVVSNGQVLTLNSLTTSNAVLVGEGSTGTLDLYANDNLVLDTTDGSTASRIEIGNGSNGVLNLSGGTLTFNIADGTSAGTSIGRIWVGGGLSAPSGGSGVMNMTSGLIQFLPDTAGTANYGAIAVGRGSGVTGSFNQSGGTVDFQTTGALDIGTQGGSGAYVLSGNAVMDAAQGGMTTYIGSRTANSDGSGTASTGSLTISDNAQFTMTTGPNSGGQLYVGDAKGTGTITQNGAGSVVTLGLANPIRFGGDISHVGGGTGEYLLSAGTLNVNNVGGSDEMVFGAAAGGTGNFVISGGTANIATQLVLADVAGSTGAIHQTGGTLSLVNGATLRFGAGTGSYALLGGSLLVGGSQGISGDGSLTLGNATLGVQGSDLSTSVNATLVSGTTFTLDTNGLGATWSGVLSGNGGLNKAGDGTLTLSGATTYTGSTLISGGTLALSGQGSLASSAGIVDNGTLDISAVTGGPSTLGSLSGHGTVITGTQALVVGTNNANSSFSGTIVNTGVGWDASYGTVSKTGSGTLTIDGATIENGETYIEGGAFAQTSGTSSISYLSVGTGAGNTGALQVSGGILTLDTGLQVGDWGGTGSVTQTGGAVIVKPGCGDAAHCASINIGNQGGTGTYTISGGTLSFSSGFFDIGRNTGSNPASRGTLAISGTGAVSVTDDGAMVIGDWITSPTEGSGVVNQTGGTLTVDGTSKLYLSGGGTDTYNLSGGTLQIGGSSLQSHYSNLVGQYTFNLGGGTIQVMGSALSANVDANLVTGTTSTIDTNGLGATWAGVLSGQGALAKRGAGTLTLIGDNTYGGGTQFVDDTVAVSRDANLGDARGALTFNGGTLQNTATFTTTRNIVTTGSANFNTNAGTTLADTAGTINGAGAITKSGAGTLVLGAIDTTGDVSVNAGVLQVAGNSSYTGATTIAPGATLALVAAGAIASSSGVNDNGNLDLSAANTTQSITSLAGSGTVNLGAQSLALTEANGTFAGVVTGSGGLSITSGTEVLTGLNTYSGDTHVSGNLVVDGALSKSTVRVDNGGILSGTGAVGGVVASRGAIVAPGHQGHGTLVDLGNYDQAAGAVLQLPVPTQPGAAPALTVAGKVTLAEGALLSLTNTWSYDALTAYPVLSAGDGISGQFTLTNGRLSAFYQLVLGYDADHVYVSADQVRSFAAAAQTPNEWAVATSLNALPAANAFRQVVAALPDDAVARKAFNQLSGQSHVSLNSVLMEQSHVVRDAISDRLQQTLCNAAIASTGQMRTSNSACDADGVVVWQRVVSSSGHIDGDGNASRVNDSASGMLIGADMRVSDDWHAGMFGGYEQSTLNVATPNDSARSDGYDLGMYAGSRYDRIYVQTGASYGWHNVTTSSLVHFAGYAGSNAGRYDVGTGQLFGEAGYLTTLGAVSLAPFASVAYVAVRGHAVNEGGSNTALSGHVDASQNGLSTLGMHVNAAFHPGATTWAISSTFGWQHAYGGLVPSGRFSLDGIHTFTTQGVPLARDAAIAKATVSATLAHGLTLGVGYVGQFGQGVRDNEVHGEMTWTF